MSLLQPIDLSVEVLRLAMTSSAVGEPHILLRGDAVALEPESRWTAEQAHRRELAAAGMLNEEGVRPDAASALRPLSRGHVQYFGYLTVVETAETVAALVGTLGEEATLAVRRGDAVRISSVPVERPAESLLTAFGRLRPAKGRPVNVSTTHGGPEVDRLAELARAPSLANAELYVAIHDHMGRAATAHEPIRFRNTAEGHWAIFAGPTNVTVVPATLRLLAARLYEARRGLSAPKSVVF
jgi:hypothetical protein